MTHFKEGDTVKWAWGNGSATGRIVKQYSRKITLTLKGTDVTREASDDCPAYKIEQADGDEVLKSVAEIEHA